MMTFLDNVMTRVCRLAVFVAVSLLSLDATAKAWDPIPVLPDGEHASALPLDTKAYQQLRRCLAQHKSAVGARYFSVVVNVTAASGKPLPAHNDAVPYVDAVREQWVAKSGIDPANHLIIAVGLKNRAVAIAPGSRWVKIGFKKRLITRTINRSAFKVHARSGDYAQAICKLVDFMDSELVSLTANHTKAVKKLGVAIKELEQQRAKLLKAIQQLQPLSPKLVVKLLELRDDFEANLTGAGVARRAERLVDGRKLVDSARRIKTRIEKAVAMARAVHAALPKLRKKLQTIQSDLSRRPDADWDGPTNAAKGLKYCALLIDQADQQLGNGKLPLKSPKPVARCLDNVEARLRASMRYYAMLTRYIPLSLAVALLVFMMYVAVARRRRQQRAKARMAKVIERWNVALQNAAGRLLEMEELHGWYFGRGQGPRWLEDSASLEQQTADAVNLVFLLYYKATELMAKVEKQVDDAGPFNAEIFDEVWDLLHSTTICFETGEAETRRRIFLPIERSFEGTAAELLTHLDEHYGRAMSLLDEITEKAKLAMQLGARCQELTGQLSKALEQRASFGFSRTPIEQTVSALVAHNKSLLKKAVTNPLGVTPKLQKLSVELKDSAARLDRSNEFIARLQTKLSPCGKRLRALVKSLNKEGFRLDEEALANPDMRLTKTAAMAARAHELFDNGLDEGACRLIDKIDDELTELEAQLEMTRTAQEVVPRGEKEVLTFRTKLEEKIPAARKILAELHGNHDPDSFAKEADNLEQLVEVLGECDKWKSFIHEAMADQRYLAATDAVQSMQTVLERGDQLLEEITAIKQNLAVLQEQTLVETASCKSLVERVASYCDDGTLRLGEELVARARKQMAAVGRFEELLDEPKPHWIVLHAQAVEQHAVLSDLFFELDNEKRSLEAALQLTTDLTKHFGELREVVLLEQHDRPHVLKWLDEAENRFRALKAAAADSALTGAALLQMATAVKHRFESAREVWITERDAITAAKKELEIAEAEFDKLDGSFSYVNPNMDSSKEALDTAKRAADELRWEEVFGEAKEARERIAAERNKCEAAEEHARQRAEERARARRAEEARRARVAAAAARAAQASSTSSSTSSSSSSSSFSSSSSSSFSSSSSSSSSSSGGSSWSSSSGGSSWSDSDSGGSSW